MHMRPASVYLLFALALLAGCDGAKVPLASSEGAPMDPSLVGSWIAVERDEGTEPDRMLVLPFNEHEYYLEYYTGNEDDGEGLPEPSRFRAYTTPIDGSFFANVQCIDCDDRLFLLFRYELSEDGLLTVHVVDEEIYKTDFETSEALYAYVKKHRDEEALYEQTVKFRRLEAGQASPQREE